MWAGELQGRPAQSGRLGQEHFQPYPSAIFRSIYMVLKTFSSTLWETLQVFPACPALLDSDLLTEMPTDPWSVFLGQKGWWQCEIFQDDMWPLWAPAGWLWFSSKPTWVRNWMYFSFLRKWPDQCSTQTPPFARAIPCLGPLRKSSWVSGDLLGKKKDISRAWSMHR